MEKSGGMYKDNSALTFHLNRAVPTVNGPTFRRSISFIFIFAYHLIGGQHLKKRICSPRSKFFSSSVDPILKGLNRLGKPTGIHKSCFPL